jgi:hypothetical protein
LHVLSQTLTAHGLHSKNQLSPIVHLHSVSFIRRSLTTEHLGAGELLRDFFRAACCTLALVSLAAPLSAGDANKNGNGEYRLLELGGRKVRWALPAGGLPPTLRYAFLTQAQEFPGARNCDSMLPPEAALEPSHIAIADFRREVRAAFSTWEAAAQIKFVEVASSSDADILIGADAKARGRAFTNVALRDTPTGAQQPAGIGSIRQSLICLNPQRPWKIGFDGNLDVYDVRFTVTHEIGHAIGLDHPSPAGQLMSFRYVEQGRGLQPGDVAGAVALYGAKGTAPAPLRQAGATMPSQATGRAGGRAFGLGDPALPAEGH